MKRPPQDPDEELKEPTTPPCADPPIWPPAEDAEVALFTIPGKPMPWASVIDVRSASRLQIAGFDPPLFEPKIPAPTLASPAPEAASIEEERLPAADEITTELVLNAETPAVGAPAVFDLELSADETVAFDEPPLGPLPSVLPDERDAPKWWAAASATAVASASRIWSTASSRVATWQTAASEKTIAGRARARAWIAARPRLAVRQFLANSITSSRETASRARSRASRRIGLWSRAMLARQLAAIAGALRVVMATRSRVVAGWSRAKAGRRALTAGLSRAVVTGRARFAAQRPRIQAARERIAAQWSHAVALWPRLVAAAAAWKAIAIRAWATVRGRAAMLPTAIAVLAIQKRHHLRMTAVAGASFLLAFGAAVLVWSIVPLAPWSRPTRVAGPLTAKPLVGVAALAPAIGQRAAPIAAEVRHEVTRPSLARVDPPRPTAAIVPRHTDAEPTTISLPSPVSRDAVRADLSSAPRERSRNTLVPAPFPTPREDALRASRTDDARINLSPPVERSGDRPVPAPFPTPRSDPPRADSAAVPGDIAASDGITEALKHLERAYQRRDVTLAKAVWPTVNERALSRAFDGLRSQSVTFDRCKLDVSGAAGEVECRGVTTYVTRVGSQDRRTESRQWKFRMQKGADNWLIMSAAAR